MTEAEVIERVRKLVRPDMPYEQFEHVVQAKPETHGFTHQAFAAERVAVELMERALVAEEALRRELMEHSCPNRAQDVLDAVALDLFSVPIPTDHLPFAGW